MNLIGFVISLVVFLGSAGLTYEIWFAPNKFVKRVDDYRNLFKSLLGFSYWTNGFVNWPLVKVMSIFLLLLSLIGIIVSITGPITY
jgi:hypothetical protein